MTIPSQENYLGLEIHVKHLKRMNQVQYYQNQIDPMKTFQEPG
jgi:hypothetical protein